MRRRNRITAFLLLSLAAMNLPQTAVLCLGGDGHVALELAGHDHCADGSHVHAYGPGGVKLHDHSHIGRPACRSCVDIPVCVGASDNRRVRPMPRLTPVPIPDLHFTIDTQDALNAAGLAESASFRLFPFGGASLRCVVLLV